MILFELHTFTNESGHTIQGRFPILDDDAILATLDPIDRPSLPAPNFFSAAELQFQTPGGNGKAQFSFEVPGTSVAEAFANYPEAFAKAEARAKDDVRKKIMEHNAAEGLHGGILRPTKGNPKMHLR